jgi:hypothetical protein
MGRGMRKMRGGGRAYQEATPSTAPDWMVEKLASSLPRILGRKAGYCSRIDLRAPRQGRRQGNEHV